MSVRFDFLLGTRPRRTGCPTGKSTISVSIPASFMNRSSSLEHSPIPRPVAETLGCLSKVRKSSNMLSRFLATYSAALFSIHFTVRR
jgi:hypothetical protein